MRWIYRKGAKNPWQRIHETNWEFTKSDGMWYPAKYINIVQGRRQGETVMWRTEHFDATVDGFGDFHLPQNCFN